MSEVILTVEQAEDWFITHPTGGVDVKRKKDNMILHCYSYPEARSWLVDGVAIVDDELVRKAQEAAD